MRGKAAKAILIATGMLMLALLAVPHHHHHHGYSICFATSQACDRCADPTHARNQDVDNCHQIFVNRPGRSVAYEPISSIAPDTFAIAFFRAFAGLEDSGLRLSYPPFTEPFVSHGNGHSLSLRAPPVFPA
ncbi:MAG: hypothetical protein ACLR76_09155 [Alistipes sp.]